MGCGTDCDRHAAGRSPHSTVPSDSAARTGRRTAGSGWPARQTAAAAAEAAGAESGSDRTRRIPAPDDIAAAAGTAARRQRSGWTPPWSPPPQPHNSAYRRSAASARSAGHRTARLRKPATSRSAARRRRMPCPARPRRSRLPYRSCPPVPSPETWKWSAARRWSAAPAGRRCGRPSRCCSLQPLLLLTSLPGSRRDVGSRDHPGEVLPKSKDSCSGSFLNVYWKEWMN